MDSYNFKVIARIKSDFPEKFGIPRQSGLVPSLRSVIHFEPEFRNPDALRGLEGFSHLWLIWIFSENVRDTWHPTVRPPRLGGNARLGVFATRSSFRPNPIAMSCVKIEEVRLYGPEGPEIIVSGADLMDGTPIIDIKPYLPYADSHPQARGGFTDSTVWQPLRVVFPDKWRACFSDEDAAALTDVLALDPRPHYHDSPERIYGMAFCGHDVRFRVAQGCVEVVEVRTEKGVS